MSDFIVIAEILHGIINKTYYYPLTPAPYCPYKCIPQSPDRVIRYTFEFFVSDMHHEGFKPTFTQSCLKSVMNADLFSISAVCELNYAYRVMLYSRVRE